MSIKQRIKQLIWQVEKRIFCYFCLVEDKKYRFRKIFGRFPIDADCEMDEDGYHCRNIYANVGICGEHLFDYENSQGTFEPYYE